MLNSPKLLYIVPTLLHGGAEMQCIWQLNWLYEHHYQVGLLVLGNIDPTLQTQLALPFHQIKTLRLSLSYLNKVSIYQVFSQSNSLTKWVVEQGYTHIIAHLPISHWAGRCIAFGAKYRYQKSLVLWTYHHGESYLDIPRITWLHKAFNQMQQFLAKEVDEKQIMVSKSVLHNFLRYFASHQHHIIYNGMPFQKVAATLAEHLLPQTPHNAYKIVLPGRFHAFKGHVFFLQVFAIFVEQQQLSPHNIQLVFAGDGEEAESIRKTIAQYRLFDYVQQTGVVSHKTILSLLKWADLVVIPSISEGFGMVAIEALMQQAIILCSDAGGLPEIIQHQKTGFLFRSQNTESCLQQLAFLYAHRHETLLHREALLAYYQEHFTQTIQMQRFCEVVLLSE
ncbi:MAG: glycosyltransferase family 4 protein [Chitinophagales bacterium]|jgi:glycosyltransferase involved in cell wall biosynthesis|nr:glycosyltransferase family 4 protein [Chitinophagales bacterium]